MKNAMKVLVVLVVTFYIVEYQEHVVDSRGMCSGNEQCTYFVCPEGTGECKVPQLTFFSNSLEGARAIINKLGLYNLAHIYEVTWGGYSASAMVREMEAKPRYDLEVK